MTTGSACADLLVRRACEAAATDHNALAAEDFETARALLLERGEVRVAAAACCPAWSRRGTSWEIRCRPASRCSTRAWTRSAGDRASCSRSGRLLAAKAAAYLVDDRLDEAIEAGEEALATAGRRTSRPGSTPRRPWARSWSSPAGWTRAGSSSSGRTRRAAELELEAEAARGYRMIGSSASTLVEYDRAEQWLDEGIEYADRTEQWNHRHYMAAHLAHVWWCRGRWDDADRAAQHALNEREGGITTRIIALHVAGFVALGRGHDESAVRFLEEARQLGDEMGELQRFAPAMWGLAECAVLRGDHAAAVALTEAGYDASHEVADAANLFPFLVTGTRARLAQSEPAAAQEWADKVSADLLARGIPGTLPGRRPRRRPDPARRRPDRQGPRPARRRPRGLVARGTGGGRRSGAPSTWRGAPWRRTVVPMRRRSSRGCGTRRRRSPPALCSTPPASWGRDSTSTTPPSPGRR